MCGNIRSQQAWKEDKMGKFRQWRGRFIDGRVFIQNIVGSMMIIPKLERSNQNIVVLSWFALWKWQIVVSMATCSSKNPKTTNVRQNEWEKNCHLHLKNAVKEVSPVQTTEMDEMVVFNHKNCGWSSKHSDDRVYSCWWTSPLDWVHL